MKLSLIYTGRFPRHLVKKGIFREKIRLAAGKIGSLEDVRFGNIEIVFLDAKELRELNNEYLGHDYETDILTFDLSESEITDGQLLISWENVLENAGRYKADPENELLRVIIHGMLHLAGYDDINDRDKKLMRKKENEYLKLQNNAGKSN